MKPLTNFSMLLVENNRSKAYLQNLTRNGFIPSEVLLLEASSAAELPENRRELPPRLRQCAATGIWFDENESLSATLERLAISKRSVPTLDINSQAVLEAVSRLKADYIVYSGPGGAILRKAILSLDKTFLHAHPGWLPDFRGSTTIYYSFLLGEEAACSVIAFTEELDGGPVFCRKRFKRVPGNDLDHVFDPAARTAVFLEFFRSNYGKTPEPLFWQKPEEGNTFYIIHPVLKHLAVGKTKCRKN